MRIIGIYKITSPNKKVYIGQSRDINKRFLYYKRLACKGQTILYRSFIKYGVHKHKFEILAECELDRLNELERYYQDAYSAISDSGMNCRLTEASDRVAVISEQTRKKQSLAKIGKTSWNKGKKGLYSPSAETRRKISENTKGEKNHFYGKKLSDYAKSKITRLGWKHSEESKAKIRESCKEMGKGIPKSEEHKAKMRGKIIPIQETMRRLQIKIDKRTMSKGTSKYLGVSLDIMRTFRNTKSGKKEYVTRRYISRVCYNGITYKQSFPETEEGEILAAKAYDLKAKEMYGQFAILNFKD